MGLFRSKNDVEGIYRGDAPVSAPGIDGAEPHAYIAQTGYPHHTALPEGYAHQAAPEGYPYPEASPAEGRPARRDGDRRRGTALMIPLAGALIAAGIGMVLALQSPSSERDASRVTVSASASSAVAPEGRHAGITALGMPIPISTADASYEITVFGAEQQIGDGWGHDQPGGRATLVVDAQIARTDGGTEPIRFTGWNWSVVDSTGDRTSGSIISHFEPSLDDPDLVGGQTVRGYVAFDTAMTRAALSVADGPAGSGLATWQITASTPRPVDGVIGEPARAELSRPGFAVTVGEPAILAAGDPGVRGSPDSGRYLVLHAEFAALPGTQGHLGIVDRERFVFVPDGEPAIFPSFGGVVDSLSIVSVDAAEPEMAALAFDTSATSGRLELRDGAGQAIVIWRIDAD